MGRASSRGSVVKNRGETRDKTDSQFSPKEQRLLDSVGEKISKADLTKTFSLSEMGITPDLVKIKVIQDRWDKTKTIITVTAQKGETLIRRDFFLEKDGKKTVKHSLLFLSEEDQGRGYTKKLFRNQLELYDKMGIDKIKIQASQIGKYAWAKYGANVTQVERDRQWEELGNMVNIKLGKTPDHMVDIANFRVKDAKYLRQPNITDAKFNELKTSPKYRDSEGNFLVGKFHLLNTHGGQWRENGSITLSKESKDRKILESYLEKK